MRELINPALKKSYLDHYRILELFDTPNMNFLLFAYNKGELISMATDVHNFLLFVVKGSIRIYSIRADGSKFQIKRLSGFLLLGDVEFGGAPNHQLIIEATEEVHCIALPYYYYREELLHDNRFLRYLVESLSEKLSLFSIGESSFHNLEEKLLHFMQNECPEGELRGVENTADHLHCSRRQLQRLLKRLIDAGKIEKIAKGKYRLL